LNSALLIQFHMSTQLDICNTSVYIPDELIIHIMNIIGYRPTIPINFFMINKTLSRSLYRILHRIFGKKDFHRYSNGEIVTLKLNELPHLCSVSRLNLSNLDDVASLIPCRDLYESQCVVSAHMYDYDHNMIGVEYPDIMFKYMISTHDYELKLECQKITSDCHECVRCSVIRICFDMDRGSIHVTCLRGDCACRICKKKQQDGCREHKTRR
jgi:hypothetical protein